MAPTTRTRARDASQSQSQTQSQLLGTSQPRPPLPGPTQLLPSLLAPLSPLQSTQFSFLSSSTAPLPSRHTVSVALPPGIALTRDEQDELWVQGQEALADAWRRLGEREGRLDEIRAQKKARLDRIGHQAPGATAATDGTGGVHKGDPLWYTAGLRYGCTCQLGKVSRGFSPRSNVPRIPAPFPPLSPTSAALVPAVGPSLSDWAAPSELTDLDPAPDHLAEFEIFPQLTSSFLLSASDRTGLGQVDGPALPSAQAEGSRSHLRRLPTDALLGDAADPNESVSSVSTILFPSQLPDTRKAGLALDRKGKGKALDPAHPVPLHPSLTPLNPSRLPLVDSDAAALLSLSRARKSLWRARIASSPSYGRIWTILPRPHALEPLPAPPPPDLDRPAASAPRRPRPGEFVLPRFYTAEQPAPAPLKHPYHPDLAGFIASRPLARVHWIIPIHGPVLIPPTPLDPASPSADPSAADASRPFPTPSVAVLLEPSAPPHPWPKDAPCAAALHAPSQASGLVWTPALLRHFWTAFLLPVHRDRLFGSLSVRVSGPKPDPFIDLPPAAPLASHARTGVGSQAPRGPREGREAREVRPVRPEAGDHIRLYVDARYALNLRLWLYGVTVDLDHPDLAGSSAGKAPSGDGVSTAQARGPGATGGAKGGAGQAQQNRKGGGTGREERRAEEPGPPGDVQPERTWRLFAKQRLTLVGERGEVLIVA